MLSSMKRNIAIFIATFVAGALVAFAARTAMHQPPSVPTEHTAPEQTAMVSNVHTTAPDQANTADAHAGHEMPAANAKPSHSGHQEHGAPVTAAATSTKPVNTVCAICGMDVNPAVPTAEYQGKKIGFGCKLCPPKFKADPDKYGPYYLRNEVIAR
jgi:hypothetical protein